MAETLSGADISVRAHRVTLICLASGHVEVTASMSLHLPGGQQIAVTPPLVVSLDEILIGAVIRTLEVKYASGIDALVAAASPTREGDASLQTELNAIVSGVEIPERGGGQ